MAAWPALGFGFGAALLPPFFGALPAGLGFGAVLPAGLGFGAVLTFLTFMPGVPSPFFGALPAGLGFGARLPFMASLPARQARCRARDAAALQLA